MVAAVPLGDHPELLVQTRAVGREQALLVPQRLVVGLDILGIELAPVPVLVPEQELGREVPGLRPCAVTAPGVATTRPKGELPWLLKALGQYTLCGEQLRVACWTRRLLVVLPVRFKHRQTRPIVKR